MRPDETRDVFIYENQVIYLFFLRQGFYPKITFTKQQSRFYVEEKYDREGGDFFALVFSKKHTNTIAKARQKYATIF